MRQFCRKCGHLIQDHEDKYPHKCTWATCKCEGLDEKLTPCEEATLKLLAKGLSNKDIAELAHLSVKTVISHRYNLMKRLKLHNIAQVIMYALAHGYIKQSDFPPL